MSAFEKLKVAFIGGGTDSVVGYSHKIAVEMDGKFEIVAGCFSQDINTSKHTGTLQHLQGLDREQ